MLFAFILGQIDTELARLTELKRILTVLDAPLPATLVAPIVLDAAEPELVKLPRVRPARAKRSPASPRLKSRPTRVVAVPVATALAHPVPSALMVVNPAQLLREREARMAQHRAATAHVAATQQTPPEKEMTASELAKRWLSPAGRASVGYAESISL